VCASNLSCFVSLLTNDILHVVSCSHTVYRHVKFLVISFCLFYFISFMSLFASSLFFKRKYVL
jgi:hypothetical protein